LFKKAATIKIIKYIEFQLFCTPVQISWFWAMVYLI